MLRAVSLTQQGLDLMCHVVPPNAPQGGGLTYSCPHSWATPTVNTESPAATQGWVQILVLLLVVTSWKSHFTSQP